MILLTKDLFFRLKIRAKVNIEDTIWPKNEKSFFKKNELIIIKSENVDKNAEDLLFELKFL
tara:strand:+ start:1101 stop:1283 length:183 start_codon:yes stop_codon:yes gene_type:complete